MNLFFIFYDESYLVVFERWHWRVGGAGRLADLQTSAGAPPTRVQVCARRMGADLASPEPAHLLTVASLLGLLFSYYASGVSRSLILKTTHGHKKSAKSRKHQSRGQTWALQHSAWPARSEHLISVRLSGVYTSISPLDFMWNVKHLNHLSVFRHLPTNLTVLSFRSLEFLCVSCHSFSHAL